MVWPVYDFGLTLVVTLCQFACCSRCFYTVFVLVYVRLVFDFASPSLSMLLEVNFFLFTRHGSRWSSKRTGRFFVFFSFFESLPLKVFFSLTNEKSACFFFIQLSPLESCRNHFTITDSPSEWRHSNKSFNLFDIFSVLTRALKEGRLVRSSPRLSGIFPLNVLIESASLRSPDRFG